MSQAELQYSTADIAYEEEDPSTLETEAGGLWVQNHSEFHSKILLQNRKQKNHYHQQKNNQPAKKKKKPTTKKLSSQRQDGVLFLNSASLCILLTKVSHTVYQYITGHV